MNLIRPLYVAAAVFTVGGLALRLAPLGRLTIAAPAALADRHGDQLVPIPVPPTTGEIDSAAADPIVAANIFARSRVAPARAARVVARADRASKAASPHTTTFTLYGTTIGPQGAVALIDDNTPPRGAHVHYMGDVIAGARLIAITDSTVTLDRPSGPLVLRLPPTMRQTP